MIGAARAALLARLDPFMVALLATVATASLLPCRGAGAVAMGYLTDAAVILLFFLHGAKLSREAILQGARSWKVHLSVLASTFVVFPALGIAAAGSLPLAPVVASGLLYLTLLPSTVQSSVAFTAVARGNVAAAVCSASLSNLIGIFLTPLLVALFLRHSGNGHNLAAVQSIVLQLLLPFAAGHLSRRWIQRILDRYKPTVMIVDRGSILLVVYTAFSAAVVDGIWSKFGVGDLLAVAAVCIAILTIVLAVTWTFARWVGFSIEDTIAVQFCGSKKSLVSGVPMAGVLFAPNEVGPIILPLMLFHQLQLLACAFLARRYALRRDAS